MYLYANIIITIGTIVVFYGSVIYSYNWILIGTVIQGISTSLLNLLTSIIFAHWFSDAEFTLVNGISLSISEIPQILCGFLLP